MHAQSGPSGQFEAVTVAFWDVEAAQYVMSYGMIEGGSDWDIDFATSDHGGACNDSKTRSMQSCTTR